MGKSTSNWKTVVNFIKSTSVEGIEAVMSALYDRMNDSTAFTPDQQAAFGSVIDKDNVLKAAAKVAAAQETGSIENLDAVQGIIATASFADVKRYVHSVDTRLKSLPPEQRDACLSAPRGTTGTPADDGLGDLAALLGGADLPPEGAYMGDDGDDSNDDDDSLAGL